MALGGARGRRRGALAALAPPPAHCDGGGDVERMARRVLPAALRFEPPVGVFELGAPAGVA